MAERRRRGLVPLILLGIGLAAAGGATASARLREPDDDDDDDGGIDFGGPLLTGELELPEDDPFVPIVGDVTPTTLGEYWEVHVVRPPARPRVGAGYQIRGPGTQGAFKTLSGTCRAALDDWSQLNRGRDATAAERQAYVHQVSLGLTNWKLYAAAPGTQDEDARVRLISEDGSLTPPASVVSAYLPMHDPWDGALGLSRAPARLIHFNRGSQGQIQPQFQWQALITPGRSRTYGALWLPQPHPAVLSGVSPPAAEVTWDAAYDWPQPLWTLLGVSRGEVR